MLWDWRECVSFYSHSNSSVIPHHWFKKETNEMRQQILEKQVQELLEILKRNMHVIGQSDAEVVHAIEMYHKARNQR